MASMHTMGDPETGQFPIESSNNNSLLNSIVPKFSVKTINFAIIVTDILLFIALQFVSWLMNYRYACTIHYAGAFYPPELNRFQLYRFFLAPFIHADTIQLMTNCISAFILGFEVEEVLNREKFFIFYLITSIYGFLLFAVGNPYAMTEGIASTVMGFIAFHLIRTLFKIKKLNLMEYFILVLVICMNLFMGIGLSNGSVFTLLGGFISGALYTISILYETEGVVDTHGLKNWSLWVLIIYPIICVVGFLLLGVRYISIC